MSVTAIDIVKSRRELKAAGADVGEKRQLNSNFQKQVRKDKEKFIRDMYKTLEEEGRAGRTRDMFKKVREITGIFKPRLGVLKKKGGTVLKEGPEVKKIWQEYTESLYKIN